MSNAMHVTIKGFELTLFDAAYLVEVRKIRSGVKNGRRVRHLPEWALRSQHAIWLTDEKAPIAIRAENGEKIKRLFLKSLRNIKSPR